MNKSTKLNQKTEQKLDFFPRVEDIRASLQAAFIREKEAKAHTSAERAAVPAQRLDNLGTSGSIGAGLQGGLDLPASRKGKQEGAQDLQKLWIKEHSYRKQTRAQIEELQLEVKGRKEHSRNWLLNKASAILNQCGKSYLVEKKGNANYEYLHSFHCKKKYCPRCADKKRNILLAKFHSFFEDSARGKELAAAYDLALFTVTLKHGEGSRKGWYFDQLKEHWRNCLKYGSFKKYLAGGIYTTEITHSEKSGFHIHRHALVLIPKEYNFREGSVGQWEQNAAGWKFNWTDKKIPRALRASWLKKTGDSFQVDLTPVNSQRTFLQNVLEVFKYVAKPVPKQRAGSSEDPAASARTVPAVVVEQLEKNCRQKFFNRFGFLYKEKDLALNAKEEDLPLQGLPERRDRNKLYFARGLFKTKTGYSFKYLQRVELQEDEEVRAAFAKFADFCNRDRQKILLTLQNTSFLKCYAARNQLPEKLRKSNETFSASGAGRCAGSLGRISKGKYKNPARNLELFQAALAV